MIRTLRLDSDRIIHRDEIVNLFLRRRNGKITWNFANFTFEGNLYSSVRGEQLFPRHSSWKTAGIPKNAAYELMKNPRYNWRRLLLVMTVRAISYFDRLTNEDRIKAIVIDDSSYDTLYFQFDPMSWILLFAPFSVLW